LNGAGAYTVLVVHGRKSFTEPVQNPFMAHRVSHNSFPCGCSTGRSSVLHGRRASGGGAGNDRPAVRDSRLVRKSAWTSDESGGRVAIT
jgi:hypothetical protein